MYTMMSWLHTIIGEPIQWQVFLVIYIPTFVVFVFANKIYRQECWGKYIAEKEANEEAMQKVWDIFDEIDREKQMKNYKK